MMPDAPRVSSERDVVFDIKVTYTSLLKLYICGVQLVLTIEARLNLSSVIYRKNSGIFQYRIAHQVAMERLIGRRWSRTLMVAGSRNRTKIEGKT